MKVCIYGAGAVGGSLGAMFSDAGHDVYFIARGNHLLRMKEWGLQLETKEGKRTIYGTFTQHIPNIPTPDYLFLCVKSYALPDIEENVNQLTGENTLVVPVVNGIPWWHFLEREGPLKDFVPRCLDPRGNLTKFMPHEHIIGSVVYTAATVTAPGTITNHKHPPKLLVGERNGQHSERLAAFGTVLEAAGFKRSLSDDIRRDLWQKLCWNIAFNPLSVLTGLSSIELTENQETRATAILLMRELEKIALEIEIPLKLDIEERMEVARRSGTHKPSMLHDFESGKRMETDAIMGSVLEIAERINIPCPTISNTYRQVTAKQPPQRNL